MLDLREKLDEEILVGASGTLLADRGTISLLPHATGLDPHPAGDVVEAVS